MQKELVKAIVILSVLVGALASVVMPAMMEILNVRSKLAWRILAPGFLMFPFIHMPMAAIIMIVTFDAALYMVVSFIIAQAIFWKAGQVGNK